MSNAINYPKCFLTAKNILELIKDLKNPIVRLPSKHLPILFQNDRDTMLALTMGYPGVIFIRDNDLDHNEQMSVCFIQDKHDVTHTVNYRNILGLETISVVSKLQPIFKEEDYHLIRAALQDAAFQFVRASDKEQGGMDVFAGQLEKAATEFYCARKAQEDMILIEEVKSCERS